MPESETSVYNLVSDGQCEKYNNILWSGVKITLKTKFFYFKMVGSVSTSYALRVFFTLNSFIQSDILVV